MLGKWFGKKAPEGQPRVLEKPEQLKIGDMVEMVDSFGLPKELRGQTLQVVKVNTYEYEHKHYPEFQLEGNSNIPIHMTVENEDGENITTFSIKISRDIVENTFDMDAFSSVFDEDLFQGLIKANDPDTFPRWLASEYRQTGGWSKGYFYERDYRNSPMTNYEHKGAEPFETVTLASDDGKNSVCIEVWEDGDTDISLALSVKSSEINAYYAKT